MQLRYVQAAEDCDNVQITIFCILRHRLFILQSLSLDLSCDLYLPLDVHYLQSITVKIVHIANTSHEIHLQSRIYLYCNVFHEILLQYSWFSAQTPHV
jgi:hypothetical protein